jgi:hypothetical protein
MDPDNREIIGGYRFFFLREPCQKCDLTKLASSHIFDFSDKFRTKYLPHLMELGRSFVHPDTSQQKWAGRAVCPRQPVGRIGSNNHGKPFHRYLFGKVTMYPQFDKRARSMILNFLKHHFGDPENLVTVKEAADIDLLEDEMKSSQRQNIQGELQILSQR